MKYGLLIEFGFTYCNFGDYAQTMAIEYLYECMDIDESNIVYLTQSQLASYDGEPLLLPFNYALTYIMDKETECVALSEKITPVFLGVTIGVCFTRPLSIFTDIEKGWIDLFEEFAPIGCRDEFTRNFLSSQGISAYLQGCITNIFPKRQAGNYSKLLLVDCPLEVLTYIPEELLPKIEVMSNEEYVGILPQRDWVEYYKKIKQRYLYYYNNAYLIVTSRYHVATPCNAMGIPCILVMRQFAGQLKDIRLDSIHPNIQLCQGDDFEDINWNVIWKEFGNIKSNILELAIKRLRNIHESDTHINEIRKGFQTRIDEFHLIEPKDWWIKKKLSNFIKNNFDFPSEGKFYIWAASSSLCNGNSIPIVDLITQINPNLKFAGWFDSYKTGSLACKPIYNPHEVKLCKNNFILVATETIIPIALQYFKDIELSEKQYIFYADEFITKFIFENYKSNHLTNR